MKNIQKLFDYSQPMVAAATLLVLAAVVVSVYAGKLVYRIKVSEDTVSVTGSAKQEVEADTGKWSFTIETKTGVNDQNSGYSRVTAAGEKVKKYLSEKGFEDVTLSSVNSYPEYRYETNKDPVMTGYQVSRTVTVISKDLDALQRLTESLAPFSGDGYMISTQPPQYTISTLPELRVSLLSGAIEDARARADAIATDSGREIGVLRGASSGVVQVLGPSDVNVSDYGEYNTMDRKKEVMVTVRAEFSFK